MLKYFLIFTTIFLCSCIEMEQEIWINSDGSGRIRIVMGLSKNLYSLINMRSDKDIQKQIEEDKTKLRQNSNVTEVEIQERMDGELWFYSVDVKLKDLQDTQQLQSDLQEIFNFSKKENSADMKSQIKVEKTGLGKYLFVYAFDEKEKTVRNAENIFKDRNFTFCLHAPHIISSNGKRNTDENMVEWKFPMADIANRKGSFLKELKAEIEIFNRQKILLALTAMITIIVAGYYLQRKKRNR